MVTETGGTSAGGATVDEKVAACMAMAAPSVEHELLAQFEGTCGPR